MRTQTYLLLAAATLGFHLSAAPTRAQQVKLGDSQSLTIGGFISASFLTNLGVFGQFGQGQNAEFAAENQIQTDELVTDGDVRNTRLRLDYAGIPVLHDWRPNAVLEADFFGGEGTPPFGDEQPRLRVRLAHIDMTNGKTTFRLGQYWSPMFGEVPVSLTHIAFPLGYGASGMVGWRFPGVFFYHGFTQNTQLQLAAMRGSGPPAPGMVPPTTPGDIDDGEASGFPQFEGRFNLGGGSDGFKWRGYAVGHVDRKDPNGPGVRTDGDGMTGWAVETGANLTPGPFTLQGNAYYGRAIGQQFGHITQQGDIRGWGAWVQGGYNLTPRWSLWGFYGVDDPDEQRFAEDNAGATLPRQRNQNVAGMLRFLVGPYAIGVEYFRAMTDWNSGRSNADQISLSALYRI